MGQWPNFQLRVAGLIWAWNVISPVYYITRPDKPINSQLKVQSLTHLELKCLSIISIPSYIQTIIIIIINYYYVKLCSFQLQSRKYEIEQIKMHTNYRMAINMHPKVFFVNLETSKNRFFCFNSFPSKIKKKMRRNSLICSFNYLVIPSSLSPYSTDRHVRTLQQILY